MIPRVEPRTLENVRGEKIPLPDPTRLVHLQFRRYAQCPVCSVHLRSFARRHEEILAANVREVILFHSPAEEIAQHQHELPFELVADPTRALYREFHVERGARAMLDPRSWARGISGLATRRGRLPHEWRDLWGKPADHLIAPDGRVLASKRGAHADDQWTVDELLELAERGQVRALPSPRSRPTPPK